MKRIPPRLALLALLLPLGCGGGGGDGGDGSPEQLASECETVDDCFPDVLHDDLAGDVLCLDRVRGGHCTHLCETDDDCCAIEGECETDLRQVCGPFESTGQRMCFLSCEPADVAADAEDEADYCQREAGPDFICRSTGGGADNKKVCVPGDCGVGASCGDDADCDAGLECVGIAGGTCTVRGCDVDNPCPTGSACFERPGSFNYCARICERESDCGFCRRRDELGACTPDLIDGMSVSVCLL